MSSLLPPDEWSEAIGNSLDSPSLLPREPPQLDRSPLKGKRYRHGSLADLVSRRNLPPGPRDLGELLNYPLAVVQVLFSDTNRAHRCLALLSQGLTDHSDYSGIGAEREAKRLLLQVLAEQYSVSVDYEYTKSCDIDPCCQQVLCHMSACLDNNASCVFADIRDQIPEEGRGFCSELEPNPGDTWLSREEVEKHYSDIKAFLLKNSERLVNEDRDPDHRAYCLVHDRDCVVNKPRSALRNPESLVIANAGNCCQGWSSEGKRARGAHLSQVPLAMWVCQRKALAAKGQEDMFFQECTPLFDIEEHLIGPLESSHRVVQVVAGPRLLGWPASRDRRLSAGLSLESLVWVGPTTAEGVQADFESLFARRPELNGSIFLQEDEGVVTDWCLEQMHKKRSRFCDEIPEGKDLLRALLPPGQLQRAEQYDREKSNHAALDGTMFCDVEHWLNSPGPHCGPMLPCLLTHGTLVELSRYRFESQESQRRSSSNRGRGSGSGHESSDKIPRYGNLARSFYALLECLPKQALPDDPPRGQFQYTLRWSEKVSIKCDLRGSFQVQHEFKQKKFSFNGVGDAVEKFKQASRLANVWKSCPPWAPVERHLFEERAFEARGLLALEDAPRPPTAAADVDADGSESDSDSDSSPSFVPVPSSPPRRLHRLAARAEIDIDTDCDGLRDDEVDAVAGEASSARRRMTASASNGSSSRPCVPATQAKPSRKRTHDMC
ncbi:unnamed protein product [Symbiodinium sp. CCMP2592]|nr:unnamed protein product [Symbiodinium sp. CCMP2592]